MKTGIEAGEVKNNMKCLELTQKLQKTDEDNPINVL